MALRVVSLPAATSRMKNDAISAGLRLSPSTSAVTSAVVRSSWGSFIRASASSVTSMARSWAAASSAAMIPASVWSGTYSGSPSPRMTLVRSKMNFSWLRGMPIMSTMIRSGSVAATSVTKSPSPRSMIVVDDLGRDRLDVALHLVELPRREAAGHDPAHAGRAWGRPC